MKPKDGFIKKDICGIPCLLPYGQNIADHIPELKLNSTASIVWDLICQGMDNEEIAKVLCNEYGTGSGSIEAVMEDIAEYENLLLSYGILEDEKPCTYTSTTHTKYFQTGSLKIAFDGPATIFDKYFKKFACTGGECQQYIRFHKGCPRKHINGRVIIRNETISVIDTGNTNGNYYIFTFPSKYGIYEMKVLKDGSAVDIYCTTPLCKEHENYIFHALRFAFLIAAQQHGMFVIHSASILYKGSAWLFSGCSGMGKSTHTKLWNELYNTPVLNGDLNIISIKDGLPVTYGLPWCGTSGVFTAASYPLGGIIFLGKAPVNTIKQLSADEKALSVMQRLVSPSWSEKLLQKNLDFAENIVNKTYICMFHCTKEPEAASDMKNTIDKLLG